MEANLNLKIIKCPRPPAECVKHDKAQKAMQCGPMPAQPYWSCHPSQIYHIVCIINKLVNVSVELVEGSM